MEFLHTMIRVKDIDASLRFFCEGLGLKEVRRVENEAGCFTLVFLASSEDIARANSSVAPHEHKGFPAGLPMLEMTYNWPEQDGTISEYDQGRNFGHVAYRVDDIYALAQHLTDMGIAINRPPRDGYMMFVRSPDNISVELLQRGERLPPQEPWVSQENIGIW